MKSEVRRKERAVLDRRQLELLLERAPVGRLALVTGDGPYVVAVNFLYLDNCIYFHGALEGRKIEALKADPRVCFLVDEVGPVVLFEKGCGISQVYESIVCFGRAEFVENAAEKGRVLGAMVRKFAPEKPIDISFHDKMIEKTAVIKIVIESMSGKANPLSPSHTIVSSGAV